MEDPPLGFLVVEDDDLVRRALMKALGEHGRVEGVATMAQAKVALRALKFDSLIVDVLLPDGIGFDLIPPTRERWPGISVLVLSGSIEHAVVSRAYELGARYLLKPISGAQLAIHVEETRGRRDAGNRRISATLERWTKDYNLSPVETALLVLGTRGVPREDFAAIRKVRPDTIRKQVQGVLIKTGDDSFDAAVNRLLRDAIAEL